jgi:gas vesicle protein
MGRIRGGVFMNGWETLIGALIGVITVPVTVWIMAKVNGKKLAEMLSGLLLKLFKGNVELVDEVENEVGKKLVEIGQAIIDAHDSKKKDA